MHGGESHNPPLLASASAAGTAPGDLILFGRATMAADTLTTSHNYESYTAECACENPNYLMSVREWCAYWGIGEPFARKLIRERQIDVVRLGRRVFLMKSEGDAVIARSTTHSTYRYFE